MREPNPGQVSYVSLCCCGGRRGMLFWGAVSLTMGVILLLTQFRLLPPLVYGLFGPLFLLALGGWILLEASRGGGVDPFDPSGGIGR